MLHVKKVISTVGFSKEDSHWADWWRRSVDSSSVLLRGRRHPDKIIRQKPSPSNSKKHHAVTSHWCNYGDKLTHASVVCNTHRPQRENETEKLPTQFLKGRTKKTTDDDTTMIYDSHSLFTIEH